ncbi:MAG: ABC transporter substrate-binding protein, partial [Dehalococcoidia bacterium]|nr:ABC transporter substrate-binding protein [Dehalococcoidia bacterium]
MNHKPRTVKLLAWIAPLFGALVLVAASCAPAAAPPAAPAAQPPSAPQPTRAATPPTPAVRAPAQADKLVIALPFPGFNTFDPILETSDRKFDIEYLYEYTVGTAADGKLTTDTGLASEWSQSEDGKSWTFKLKPGSMFQNGEEVTADDAKFSLDRLVTDKRAVVTYVSLFKAMIDKVEVKDKYTYTVSTKGTQALLPHFLSPLSISLEGMVVSKKYFDQVGEKDFAAKPVGSGPYKVVSNDPGQKFEFESVGKHRMMANPPAKRLVFTNVKEPTTRIALLRTKEADIASIPLVSKKEVQQAGIRTFSKPEDFFSTIHIHAQDPKYPVSNKLVRQA